MRFAIQHTEKGFTLIEILVAILIFAIVMSSLFISFRSLLFEPAGVEKLLGKEEMARSALERMMADLEAIYIPQPPLYRPPGSQDARHPHRLVGSIGLTGSREFGRLRFSSLAHLPMRGDRRRGIAQIVYYVQGAQDETYLLRRADDLEPYPDPEALSDSAVLCEQIEQLTFSFVDEEGEEHEVWDSDAKQFGYATPAAIRIRLELKGEETPHVFETETYLPVKRMKSS